MILNECCHTPCIFHWSFFYISYILSYFIFLPGKSKATIRAMIPMAAIIINCNVKLDNG